MASTLEIFDVDITRLQVALPQIGMGGTSDVLTTARVTVAIQDAASEVCSVLIAMGVEPSDIGAETTSTAYHHCQRLVVALALPILLRAVQGLGAGASAELDALEVKGREMLNRIEINPAILGWNDDSVTPGTFTTVSDYDSLTDTDPMVYRTWQDHAGQGPKW